MSIGDANTLSREDTAEMGKLADDLVGKAGGEQMMTVRVEVLNLTMLLREVVHLRKQVDELQARGTLHVLERQGGAPWGWNYNHQWRVGPYATPTAAAVAAFALATEQGCPRPDPIGYSVRVWPMPMMSGADSWWYANVIWKAE
jgi:hypothetical protein